MAQYGVNVPPGMPVFKLDDVLPAAEKMADDSGQVICSSLAFSACQRHGTRASLQQSHEAASQA